MCDVSPTHALAHARAHAQNQTLTVQVSVQKWSCTVTCLSRMSAPGSNSSRFAMAWPWRIFEPQTDCRTRQRPWTRRTICTSHADAGLSTSNPKPRSLVCDGQTSPHRPRLVVSHSTCPPLSSPPHANSFVIGPAVIKHTHRVSIYSIPYPAKCWNFSSTCTFPRPPHRLPLHGKFRGKHAIYGCSLEIVRDLYIGLGLFHRPSSVSLWTAPFSQHCAKR